MRRSRFYWPALLLVALAASVATPGCGTITRTAHMQSGIEVGTNMGDEPRQFDATRAIVELGYVDGATALNPPRWGFGGTGYLSISEDFRPGLKAVARRYVNDDLTVDLSAGPMITYDSSGLFNGFVGGVSMNLNWFTLRTEIMTWPFEAWDESRYSNGVLVETEHHPSGHEQVWSAGVAFNGTAGWWAAVIGFFAFWGLVAASGGS